MAIRGKRTKRVALARSERRLPKGSKRVGAADPDQHMEISVRLRPKKGLDDGAVLALGARPLSQRQYLTREQFATQAGASPDDVAKIDDFAHQHGLNVKSVHLASRTVKLTGTVGAFSDAFGVKLSKVKHAGATYRMRTGSVMIPDDLKGIVVGVHGLDNRPVALPHFRMHARKAARRGRAAPRNGAGNGSFTVTDIAKLYNVPTGVDGTGQCIAIIELNDITHGRVSGAGYQTSDLAAFFKAAGVAMPSITSVSVDGGANLPGHSESDGEVVLDIEVAGAIAPGAKIAVYFTPNTTAGFIDAVKAAANDAVRKPSVISISWGGPEDPGGSQQFLDGLNEAVRDATAMGVTVCIASGDNGSADMPLNMWDGKPHADFPASSPFALACGGTKLTAANGGIGDEVVWNEGPRGGAGGGGASVYFPLPPYQGASNVPKAPTQFAGRGVPDVAGDADPESGYQIVLDGQSQTIGGTSAVAPLMAGLIALINQAASQKFNKTVGLINPLIYAASAKTAFRDIVDGNNDITGKLHGLYGAERGWDACSGLGVPNGTSLMQLLVQ